MDLKKALEIQVNYFDRDGSIRVDENGYVNLNDLNDYFPQKDLKEWMRNKGTSELIEGVDRFLNRGDSPHLGSSVVAKRGRYKAGTYAHELVAMDFAAWLSVEFKIQVYQAYINGTQRKQDWNIKRILAANNFKMMSESVQGAHDPVKSYHFSNEARMLNAIVFGNEEHTRDDATEEQLDRLSWLQSRNAAMIDLGLDYQQRKAKLAEIYITKMPKSLQEVPA